MKLHFEALKLSFSLQLSWLNPPRCYICVLYRHICLLYTGYEPQLFWTIAQDLLQYQKSKTSKFLTNEFFS